MPAKEHLFLHNSVHIEVAGLDKELTQERAVPQATDNPAIITLGEGDRSQSLA